MTDEEKTELIDSFTKNANKVIEGLRGLSENYFHDTIDLNDLQPDVEKVFTCDIGEMIICWTDYKHRMINNIKAL